jgi:hypothetical protein
MRDKYLSNVIYITLIFTLGLARSGVTPVRPNATIRRYYVAFGIIRRESTDGRHLDALAVGMGVGCTGVLHAVGEGDAQVGEARGEDAEDHGAQGLAGLARGLGVGLEDGALLVERGEEAGYLEEVGAQVVRLGGVGYLDLTFITAAGSAGS